MRRVSSRLTSGRKSTPRTRVKIAALAPMPRARVSTTVIASPLVRASERSATLKSRRKDICFLHPGRGRQPDSKSAPGDGAYNQQRLFPGHHGVGQRGVRRFVGQILFACEEAQEWAALLRDVIANGAMQHRILGLERIDHRAHRWLAGDFELHFTADASEPAQVRRQHDADHGSVWTSTESTAGRSRTMAA